jgi:Tfp pilus assembly protein PilO
MSDFLKGTVTPKDWAAVLGILAVTVLLCVAFTIFVRGQQKETLAGIEQDDRDVLANLAIAAENKRDIGKLEADTEKTRTVVAMFEERLPSQREIPTLVREFEDLATQAGVAFEVQPKPPVKDDRKETIPYAITTYGDFHQMVDFVNRLERYKRYLKVSDLRIEEQKQGVSKGTFTLSTYRFIQQQEQAGAAS